MVKITTYSVLGFLIYIGIICINYKEYRDFPGYDER